MLISCAWLAELCPVGVAPQALAAALTSRGLTVDAVTATGKDTVLDLDVPANRPDCLGHLGVARELSAAFDVPLAERPAAPAGEGPSVDTLVRVQVDDPESCPRYTARVVRGAGVGPSPDWVTERLAACGLRPINRVVDVTNLVMLELGQPIHAFDLARLDPSTLCIRRASAHESFTTLEGTVLSLDPDMLVIADRARAVALAGVVGGSDTAIGERTRDVLIEAACFLPRSVRATARRLGLATDASYRFERGVDPEAPALAQDLAVRWLVELSGGTALPGRIDVGRDRVPRSLTLRIERVCRLLGYSPGAQAVEDALEAVGLAPARLEDSFRVTVPSWRMDLEIEADLVEEVARHLGYDRIPARLPDRIVPRTAGQGITMDERARDRLAGLGFHESFNYAMVGVEEDLVFAGAEPAPSLRLANPLAETLATLRRTLLPGLLRATDLNLRRGVHDVRLFEVGRVFREAGGGRPDEPLHAALAWAGAGRPRHFSRPDSEVDPYDALGAVENVVEALAPDSGAIREPARPAGLDPGRSAAWTLPSGARVAWCGPLHPDLHDRLDLPATVYLAELDLDALEASGRPVRRQQPLPRVPTASRDLSLMLPPGTSYRSLEMALRSIPAPAQVSFEVIDRYEGSPLPSGQVSLTVRVILQPLEKTLTDEETEAYRDRLVARLRDAMGVQLRS